MNLLAGMILIGVDFDEVAAFAIFERLMRGKKHNWRRIYGDNLATLFPLTDHVYSWMLGELPDLEAHLQKHCVPLVTLMCGPFLALFSNIIKLEAAMHVLDRLILAGEESILSIIKHILKT
jgi:hypothetical protein